MSGGAKEGYILENLYGLRDGIFLKMFIFEYLCLPVALLLLFSTFL